jgi:hypothetical protein
VNTYTAADMAEKFGHAEDWWKRQSAAKKVPHHRDGRRVWFTDDDVAAYLRATEVRPHDPLRGALAPRSKSRSPR